MTPTHDYYYKYLKYKKKYLQLAGNYYNNIIHVAGSRGSGKTYLCNQLNKIKIKCFDLDEYLYQLTKDDTYINKFHKKFLNYMDSDWKNIPLDKRKAYVKYYQTKINSAFKKLNDEGLCVLVGIFGGHTVEDLHKYHIINAKHKFFIDISNKKLIKQKVNRHLDNICNIKKDIAKNISETQSDWIAKELNPKEILMEHKKCEEYYLKHGYVKKTQKDIFNEIKKILSLEGGNLSKIIVTQYNKKDAFNNLLYILGKID